MTDIDRLIAAHLDRTATDEQAAALERWIKADRANARRFLLLCSLHTGLRDQLGPREGETSPAPLKHGDGIPGRASPPEAPPASIPIYRKGHEPKSAVSNFQFSIFNLQFQLIAAALLVACGLAIYFSSLPHSAIPDPTSPPPLATLIDSTDTVIVNDGIGNPGEEYAAGDYAIDTGTAQFLLTNRVAVNLRGKTRIHLRNAANIYLNTGRAEFNVPHGVDGFTVHLPDDSRVVDLGTRFAITAEPDGASELVVLDGEVRIDRTDGSSLLAPAGRVYRIAADAPTESLHGPYTDWLAWRCALDGDDLLYELNPAGSNHTVDAHGTTTGPGRFERRDAIVFNGTTDFVPIDIPDPHRRLTIGAWVKIRHLNNVLNDLIAADGNSGVHLHLWPNGRLTATTIGMDAKGTPPLITRNHLNRWVHLVVVADHIDGKIAVYRDGGLFYEAVVPADRRGTMRIGSARVGHWDPRDYPLGDRDRGLAASIDELLVLARAVTADEVRAWYRSGNPSPTKTHPQPAAAGVTNRKDHPSPTE